MCMTGELEFKYEVEIKAKDKRQTLPNEVKEELKNSGDHKPSNVTNALFVGSTAELQKMLKGDKKNDSKRDSDS